MQPPLHAAAGGAHHARRHSGFQRNMKAAGHAPAGDSEAQDRPPRPSRQALPAASESARRASAVLCDGSSPSDSAASAASESLSRPSSHVPSNSDNGVASSQRCRPQRRRARRVCVPTRVRVLVQCARTRVCACRNGVTRCWVCKGLEFFTEISFVTIL